MTRPGRKLLRAAPDAGWVRSALPWGGSGAARPVSRAGRLLYSYPPNRRSDISCWRRGILSMERDSSRTLQGDGLRRATRPSLPISAIMYPRGRSFVRNSVSALGSVSVMMITSRSARSSRPSISRSNCCWKRGSLGVSAKTTKGRTTHCSSAKVISAASKTCVWSSSHRSSVVASSAESGAAIRQRTVAMFVNSFMKLDIEAALPKAKGIAQISENNFAIPAAASRRLR